MELHLGCQHYQWRVKATTCPNNVFENWFAFVMAGSFLELFFARAMKEVCYDVQIELPMGVDGSWESSNIVSEIRRSPLDVSARGFWVTGQKAFFDIFSPLTKRYVSYAQCCYILNENEKERSYNNWVMEVEHESLTPMLFSPTGGCGRECIKAIRRLALFLFKFILTFKNYHFPFMMFWVDS